MIGNNLDNQMEVFELRQSVRLGKKDQNSPGYYYYL